MKWVNHLLFYAGVNLWGANTRTIRHTDTLLDASKGLV